MPWRGAHPARKWQPVGFGVLARAAIAGEAGFPATDPSQGLVDGQTVDQGGGGRQGQHRLGDDGIPTNPLQQRGNVMSCSVGREHAFVVVVDDGVLIRLKAEQGGASLSACFLPDIFIFMPIRRPPRGEPF